MYYFMEHALIDIKNEGEPNNEQWLELMEAICKEFNFNILSKKIHYFTPQGLTAFFLLSESHIGVHTWPEHNRAYMDIFSCSKNFKLTKEVLEPIIKKFLNPSVLNIEIINREI